MHSKPQDEKLKDLKLNTIRKVLDHYRKFKYEKKLLNAFSRTITYVANHRMKRLEHPKPNLGKHVLQTMVPSVVVTDHSQLMSERTLF